MLLSLGSHNLKILRLITLHLATIRTTPLEKHLFGLLCCSDTYPGTISDKDITEQAGVLNIVNKGKVVLTDKGFDITELCLKKGVLHNRPPMKFSDQYEPSEISANFDIATLRVYNENYIGRMRDWAILNSCWPMTRIDLLGHCFKVFAHVVNILKTPVGPKISNEIGHGFHEDVTTLSIK